MLESPERLSRMNIIGVGRELINVKMYLYNGTYEKRCLVNLNRLPVGRFGSTSALRKEVQDNLGRFLRERKRRKFVVTFIV